jgi:putative cell wall-binding protein
LEAIVTAATSRLRRRGIGAGVAALVGLTGLGLAAVPAQAAPGFDPSAASAQVAGVDRFDTAARIATATFTTASTVVIANGDRVIDAQAAGYVAGQQTGGAPILLTQTGTVPQFTLDAIKKLGATKAIVIGDNVSVSTAARAQLTAAGLTLTSIAGDNRFDTAADIYNTATTKAKTVFLARGDYLTGQVSPDALAAGPIAYKGTPILLTNSTTLPAETKAAIVSGGVTKVVVLGNTISDAVKTELRAITGVTVETIAGGDRSETAALLADSTYGSFYNRTSAAIANGEKVDALSAGPWAATKGTPLLLTLGTNAIGAGTTSYLDKYKATLTSATVFGDANSVPATFTAAAKAAGGGNVTSLQTVAVAPTGSESFTVQSENGTTPTADDRTYTVTGLTAGTTYRITLVNGASIRTAADGSVTFLSNSDSDSPSGFSVNPGDDIADISSVNNATPTFALADASAARTTTVVPVNGSITFTVDGTGPGTVVPVVYVNGAAGQPASNGGTSTRLETSATVTGAYAAATENYGLGGSSVFNAALATGGAVTGDAAGNVTSVDKAVDSFTTAVGAVTSRYTYDSNDVFFLEAGATDTSIGLAQFEAALSGGDNVAGIFAPEGGVSSFTLTDDDPAAPSAVVAASGTGATSNDITVTVTPASADFDSVVIQRAPVVGGTDGAANGTVGTYTTIATATTDADLVALNFQYVDNDVTAGVYRYRAAVVNDGDTGPNLEATNNEASVTPSTDTAGPLAVDTRIASNSNGSALTLDTSDTYTIAFNEVIAAPAATATLRLTDADGTVVDFVNTGGTPFVRNGGITTIGGVAYPANTTLTVTATSGTVITPGSGVGLSFPIAITAQSGITDTNLNPWNIAGSTDVTIDNE